MKKKFLILLLTFTVALSSIMFADSTVIMDIDKSSSYAKNSILYLAEQKVISGDQNGNFLPQKSVTRAEMVALMAKAMNLDVTLTPETATFKDVPVTNWAFKYVEAAYKEGIVTGVTTTEFKPNDNITREQMALIFVRALKLVDKNTAVEIVNINAFADKSSISSWAQKEVEAAIEAGLMNGVSATKFEPKMTANKEQSAVVVERLMKNKDQIVAKFKMTNVDKTGLYNALDQLAYYDYVGETRANGVLKITDSINSESIIKTSESYSRQSDPYTAQFNTKDVIQQTGEQTKVVEQNTIIIGDKWYDKDPKDNKWVASAITNEGIYYTDNLYDPMYEEYYIDNISISQQIFDNFDKLDIKNEGVVYISGIPAIKFAIYLDSNSIKSLMTEEEYIQVKEFFDEEFPEGVKYTYTFYVANNAIVKQGYKFEANGTDDVGTPIHYYTNTAIYFKNIGKQLSITAPPASQIK